MGVKLRLFDLKLDKTRKVRIDLGVLEDAEEVSGYNYLGDGLAKMNARALKALVWASLRNDDPDLTLEDVRVFVHAGNFSEVYETMLRAYVNAMPEKKDEKASVGAEGND